MERSLLFRPRLGFGIFCLLLIAWFFGSANAMTFEIVQVGDEPAIISHGEIVSGDADRLRMVLIARAKHSLNSPEFPRHPAGSVFAFSQTLPVTACRS